jgi:catechol 2,3-dioxygenase-like lactoylglutathione lyase family enzyme
MKMNHLALSALDVPSESAFYCTYFGFKPARGPGFLVDGAGFVLTIDAPPEPVTAPSSIHFGFHLASHDDVRTLYERMKADGVQLAQPVTAQGPTVCFFCHDPAGYLVEIRA